ncbi:MAG: gliding motility-associated ABC transporter substrate-binding protein GldG [Prevotellaceae bacterium]|jgi:ABC-2 type transport system permease protein|nr:gliding motility-associated ABC transporter substrate-binding protein GldG [Prevotellaceae bacterium]
MNSKKHNHTLYFFGSIAAILLLNIIMQHYFFRIDFTSDKRFTLANVSKEVIQSLEQPVYIHVYLEGEMPVSLKKMRQSIIEMLDELKVYAKGKLQYRLINPSEGSKQKREAMYRDLFAKGLQPIVIQESDSEGGNSQRMIFPGVLLSYSDREKAINFLVNNPVLSEEENLSLAIQNLEFELVSAISLTSRKQKPKVAFIEGHGELDEYESGDIARELSQYYTVERIELNGEVGGLDEYSAAVIAKPSKPWSESDKLVVDQYLMNGGSVAWFIDAVTVAEDSLNNGEVTYAIINEHKLDDQLFKYGVRINPNVIQDLSSVFIPVNVAGINQPPNFRPVPFYYHPLPIPDQRNSITKNLNLIKAQYPSSIDTIGSNNSVQRTVLLTSSQYSRAINAPFMLSLRQIINEEVSQSRFNQSFYPIAVLVEGEFQSVFANRILTKYNNEKPFDFTAQGKAKMVVVSDGDIIRNETTYRSGGVRLFSLGYDKYMNQTFGNKEFVKNIMLYLTNDNELLNIRKKDFSLRLLDKTIVAEQKNTLIFVNVAFPILFVILTAIAFTCYRKRKYSR